MNRRLWIAIAMFGICTGLGASWLVRHRQLGGKSGIGLRNSGRQEKSSVDCRQAADDSWQTVKIFDYEPFKTAYTVEWQNCPGLIEGRVRVMDGAFEKVLLQYDDDDILRVENLDLLDDHFPQLLVMTGSSGTDDRVDWHIISEADGKLHEWTAPDYDSAAKKVLRAGEDFCCKEWNFHLQRRDVILARGIYQTGEANCCPSRGGVLVRLKSAHNAFRIASIARISNRQYARWRSQPFCLHCVLE